MGNDVCDKYRFMRKILLISILIPWTALLQGQELESFTLTPEWTRKIEKLAPEGPKGNSGPGRDILIFSLHTGYEHWSIPHTEAVVKILAEKSGVARSHASRDISVFEKVNLQEFDAVVLNNTCPERDHRDIFYDVYRKDPDLSESERWERAARLEKNLIEYVAGGGGLVLLHGGTTMQINSMAFSEMTGGSFDFHPPQQPVHMQLAEPDHILLRGFNAEGLTITDEPYFFKNAYDKKDFRPLLYMDARELTGLEGEPEDPIRYIAWIKPHGKGRVFVSAPTHNAQNFENPQLLQFLSDGLRYAIGELDAPDSPVKSR